MVREIHRLIAFALSVALVIVGCAAGTPSSTASHEASASPAATPSPTSQPSQPSQASATSSPAASPKSAASTLPAGFGCTYPLVRAATTTRVVQVRNIRLGEHPTYDRIVFDLAGTGLPALRLEEVSPPLGADPSDRALTVAGHAFIKIVLNGASGAGYATGGAATYTGPTSFKPGYPRLVSLVERGDFEAVFSWYAGLSGPACYRVLVMTDPTRLVIDFAATP